MSKDNPSKKVLDVIKKELEQLENFENIIFVEAVYKVFEGLDKMNTVGVTQEQKILVHQAAVAVEKALSLYLRSSQYQPGSY